MEFAEELVEFAGEKASVYVHLLFYCSLNVFATKAMCVLNVVDCLGLSPKRGCSLMTSLIFRHFYPLPCHHSSS